MSNTLNQIESAILQGAVNDLERNRTLPQPAFVHGSLQMINTRQAIADAADGMVRVDASRWLGLDTRDAAMRVAVSRAYKRLQDRDLIMRVAGGYSDNRCTHLRPTEAGIALAKSLTEKEPTE